MGILFNFGLSNFEFLNIHLFLELKTYLSYKGQIKRSILKENYYVKKSLANPKVCLSWTGFGAYTLFGLRLAWGAGGIPPNCKLGLE